jgi:hypothetical protein
LVLLYIKPSTFVLLNQVKWDAHLSNRAREPIPLDGRLFIALLALLVQQYKYWRAGARSRSTAGMSSHLL